MNGPKVGLGQLLPGTLGEQATRARAVEIGQCRARAPATQAYPPQDPLEGTGR